MSSTQHGSANGPPVRHELNTGFEWAPINGPFRRISEEQATSYNQDGFFVLEGAIDDDLLADVTAECDRFEAEMEAFLRSLEGGRAFIARAGEITFTTHLVTRSATLRAFCASEVFCDLAADVLGPDVRLYWDQAVYKKPGADDPFPWHQDNGYTFLAPQQYLTCWVALTDATVDNGCPWVVPGLHRRGTFDHELTDLGYVCIDAPVGAVPAPVNAGGLVAFSSLTPHATGPNRTGDTRKAYIVQFAPDGAVTIVPGPDGALTRTPAADPDRQFQVLVDGRPTQPVL